jgi:hypothetical protein
VSFHPDDARDIEHLYYYLRGLFVEHPDWQVAVIGAMYEDDVMRVANLLTQMGFNTTVLTRYCLSNQTFINLDHLWDHLSWVGTAGLKEGEPYRSWLEDWMEEHGMLLEPGDAPDEE